MVTQNMYKVTFTNKVSRLVKETFFLSLDISTFYKYFEYAYTRFKGKKMI